MRRGRPGEIDPHLDLKIGIFFLAAVLGISGMVLGRPLPIYAAMVVIGAGLLLRFLRPPGPPGPVAEDVEPESGAPPGE